MMRNTCHELVQNNKIEIPINSQWIGMFENVRWQITKFNQNIWVPFEGNRIKIVSINCSLGLNHGYNGCQQNLG